MRNVSRKSFKFLARKTILKLLYLMNPLICMLLELSEMYLKFETPL